MTRPVIEPATQRDLAALEYNERQVVRRPPPAGGAAAGPIPVWFIGVDGDFGDTNFFEESPEGWRNPFKTNEQIRIRQSDGSDAYFETDTITFSPGSPASDYEAYVVRILQPGTYFMRFGALHSWGAFTATNPRRHLGIRSHVIGTTDPGEDSFNQVIYRYSPDGNSLIAHVADWWHITETDLEEAIDDDLNYVEPLAWVHAAGSSNAVTLRGHFTIWWAGDPLLVSPPS